MDENKTSTFFVRNQQKIAIAIGYLLVFLLAFGLGRITNSIPNPPEIRIEEPTALQPNNTPNVAGTQTGNTENSTTQTQTGSMGASFTPIDGQCLGKIKGNTSVTLGKVCTIKLFAELHA